MFVEIIFCDLYKHDRLLARRLHQFQDPTFWKHEFGSEINAIWGI
jgi:hypothetical protein